MPFYEYHCPDCREDFEELRTLADRDQPAPCPKCGGRRTYRKISLISAVGGAGTSDSAVSSCSSGGFS
jgi:putative FmdB family regulatory protein